MPLKTVIDLPVSREVVMALSDIDQRHKRVMSFFPDLHGISDRPRSDLGIVHRVEMPKPGGPRSINIVVYSDVEIGPESQQLMSVREGDRVRLRVLVAAERRTTTDGVRRRFSVRDSEIRGWAVSLLLRAGMDVTAGMEEGQEVLTISGSRQIGRRTGVNFTGREIDALATITDEKAANEALHRGIGRGKSYGLGLILFARVG